MFSVSSLWMNSDTLVVRSDDVATNVALYRSGSDVRVSDLGTGHSWIRSNVGMVEFQGGNGNDRLVNYVSDLPIRAFGNAGDDYLEGYNGADTFVGGAGNDTLVGYGGNDRMWGGDGNDVLRGMYGNDQLIGNNGDDKLDGGSGNDTLWGSAGNDTLLGGSHNDKLIGDIGDDHLNGQGGTDTLWGGAGNDVLVSIDSAYGDYVDSGTGAGTVWRDHFFAWGDNVVGTTSSDMVQNVAFFSNGADRTLDGDRITDPTVKAGQTYRTFSDNPLFSDNGPRLSDIKQGQLGDCYALSGLGAIANDSPHAIVQNVVDFDDGTYGVRLGNYFFRVDHDLPVNGPSGTTPAYAGLGAQDSMWVAIVEKAFTHYCWRAGNCTGRDSYPSIEGGSGVEMNQAFRSASAGWKPKSSFANATEMANDIFNRWNTYQAVTIDVGGPAARGGAPLVMGHSYTVASVTRNAWGTVTSITLRNPWGVDGGGNVDANPNDGYVTITPAQLFAQDSVWVNWGRV